MSRLRSPGSECGQESVDVLDELDEAGGLRRLAAGWSPKVREKYRATLTEARKSLEGALAELKDRPRTPPPG